MSLNFDAAAVQALFDAVESKALSLGLFERVGTHEPKNAPGSGLSCSIWIDSIRPEQSSGLAAVSGRVTFHLRVYTNMLQEPQDAIDPAVLAATCGLLAAYSGAFTLGGTVRNIDVMQASAQAGYMEQDRKFYRVMLVTLPVIINDLWTEVP